MNDKLSEFKLSKKAKAKLKNKKLLEKELAAGKSTQEILELSEKSMEKFYAAAMLLLENRHFTTAAEAFLFLATLNAYREDYWIGLGRATQLNGDYESAIEAYDVALICKPENPVPYFYLAKCFFAMHDREKALQSLNLAIEYSEEFADYMDIKQQALAVKLLIVGHEK